VANVAGMEWNESPGVTPGLKGAEVIQAFVRHLPNQPGVYRMMNEAGDVLYVGKARSLKKRVTNYAQGRGHSNRITRMIAQTTNMEFVTTRTETEALLLEANLIKRLKPRFNVLDARRQVVPLYPGDRRSRGAGYLQAPWRAIAQGILFRPLRISRCSGTDDQCAAARLSSAHLHRQRLRKPHSALPALPDQALRRALHRRDRCRGLCPAGG
jgi:predicted GIY-YIG superfamily endonuclease